MLRLITLHKDIGAVGGSVIGSNNTVIDSCYIFSKNETIVSPWKDKNKNYLGNHSLYCKPQTVFSTGNYMAFIRFKYIKNDLQRIKQENSDINKIRLANNLILKKGGKIIFSPLVKANSNYLTRFQDEPNEKPPRSILKYFQTSFISQY